MARRRQRLESWERPAPPAEQVAGALASFKLTVPLEVVATWNEDQRRSAAEWMDKARSYKARGWSPPHPPDFIWQASAERRASKP